MNSEITSASVYLESLRQKYPSLDIPFYKLRPWFSKANKVFFDCREQDKIACLQTILKESNFEAFTIFLVIREQSGIYRFMDASFRNLGSETLEHFITRFHSQLESMTKLGIQATRSEYIECVGHSYVESSKQSQNENQSHYMMYF